MKILNTLFVLIFVLFSCKNKITNVTFIRDLEKNKKIKSFVLFNENNMDDTLYIYKPISFKLTNQTRYRLRYKYSNQSSNLFYSLFFYNNKKSPKELYNKNLYIDSKKEDYLTYYFKIPISKKEIENYPDFSLILKSKKDSLSISLPKTIDDNFEKKLAGGMITLSLTRDKYDNGVGLRYCFNRDKTIVYDIDSLNKVNPKYKFECK